MYYKFSVTITSLLIMFVSTQVNAGYLGMRVQDLPIHVRAHMPVDISSKQSVIVDWLEDISPAADDGIKLYDVLLSYNNQAITSPTQLYQEMQKGKAGEKVTLTLVRQGEVLKLPVTLTDAPTGIKMTPPPKQSTLYHPSQSGTRPLQKRNTQAIPPSAKVFNIAGKPAYPMHKKPEKHAWGTERNIWPDFYTDGTNELWDKMINGPFKMGRMPGGWRAPSLSMPDPVTIGDAVTNQMPPMAEEMGNMIDVTK